MTRLIGLLLICLLLGCSAKKWERCPECGADLNQGFTDAVGVLGPDKGKHWQACWKCDWTGPKE